MNAMVVITKNKFMPFLYILILLSCQSRKNDKNISINQNTIKKLQINYVNFYITTISSVNCSDFNNEFKEQIEVLIIENDEFLAKFNNELQNLKQVDKKVNIDPNARATIDISYSDMSVKRVCLSLNEISINDKSYLISERLRDLLIEKRIIEIPY